jgi:hypothetical protein
MGVVALIEFFWSNTANPDIGKFNRGADQSSGSGGFLLLKFACFDLISLWDLSG